MVSQPFLTDTNFFLCLLGKETGGIIGDEIFKTGEGLLRRSLIPIKGKHLIEIGHPNLILNIRDLFMARMNLLKLLISRNRLYIFFLQEMTIATLQFCPNGMGNAIRKIQLNPL